MSDQKLAAIQTSSFKKNVPQFGPGYTVSVYQKIKEGGKERVQIFKGLVIKMSAGRGVDKTFTVRKIVDGIGVEKIFPLHSPNIEKIVPEKIAKIRRAKLYYIRERSGKSARFRETHLSEDDVKSMTAEVEEIVVEEPANEEVAEAEEVVNEESVAEESKEESSPEEPQVEEEKKEEEKQ